MKIALVHDYLTQFGGGERVLAALCEIFPEAPIFTLLYDKKATGYVFEGRRIHTSFLQKIPGAKRTHRLFLWLMPLAVEQFDLNDFDAVISVCHSFSKGVITNPKTKHICYCLTPTRYLWHDAQGSLAKFSDFKFPAILKPFSRMLLTYLRLWDYQAAQRVDHLIASSENVRQRIKRYYNRDSEVIYPPVETEKFNIPGTLNNLNKFNNYLLMVGRLVPYKRFDIAIDAFSKLAHENLFIIGDGPEYRKLKSKSEKLKLKNIKFLGQVSDSELPKYYANCKALIFPQEEDFGIVPLEAMVAGKPVIAYAAGGALETIIENETGLFFDSQSPEKLAQAIQNFDPNRFDSQKIREHALKFDKKIFQAKIQELVNNASL